MTQNIQTRDFQNQKDRTSLTMLRKYEHFWTQKVSYWYYNKYFSLKRWYSRTCPHIYGITFFFFYHGKETRKQRLNMISNSVVLSIELKRKWNQWGCVATKFVKSYIKLSLTRPSLILYIQKYRWKFLHIILLLSQIFRLK